MIIYYLFYFFVAVAGVSFLLTLIHLGHLKWYNFIYLFILTISCSGFAYIIRPPAPNQPMSAFFWASLRSSRMMNCESARIYLNTTERYETLLNKDYERVVKSMRQACLDERLSKQNPPQEMIKQSDDDIDNSVNEDE